MPEVVCLGVLVADVIGKPIRKFPEWGRLELVEGIELHSGGCACNTGIALAKLGVSVGVIGKVGSDAFGDFLIRDLQSNGIDTGGILRSGKANTSATVVLVSDTGERSFLHFIGANSELRREEISLETIRGAKVFHIGGALILPGLDGEPMAELLREVKAMGITTSLDTVWDATGSWMKKIAPCLPYTDIFLPSYGEAVALSGEKEPDKLARFFQSCGVRIVAVKMGENGAYVRDEQRGFHVPAMKVTPVDTTGAGDCYVAGFLAAYLRGWALEKTARFANAVGACCVTAVGASTGVKSFEETLAMINQTTGF